MKRVSMIRAIIVIAGMFLLITSCSKTNDEELIASEDRYFDLFINANYPDIQPLESGLYYIDESTGTGISPDSGDYILINYVARYLPEKTIFDTYVKTIAIDNSLYSSGVLYGPIKYQHGNEIAGLKEGLSLMKEGGVATLIFKSDLGYGSAGYGAVGAYTSLMYDMELVEVIKDVKAREDSIIAAILDTLSYPYTEISYNDTAKMYYVETETGIGDLVDTTDVAYVYYTGYLPDGRVFDTNIDGDSLEVDMSANSVILGWQLGLPHFSFGGSGILIIPWNLAYGAAGATENGKVSIPPYQTLIFDIKVQEEYE